jgi:transposase InsO family protein
MAQAGIGVRPKRRFKLTTDSNHPLPIAPNVLGRNFTTTEPDQAWVDDITYIATLQSWLYLAVMIDLFSRRAWDDQWQSRCEWIWYLMHCKLHWGTGFLLHLG